MISRHWKGVTKPGQAEAYVRHLRREIFPALAAIPGFLHASILKREVNSGTEFQIVTVWESLSAIAAFAGQQLDVAVVTDRAQAMLSSYEQRVAHYEVAYTFTP
jgi:heme-degrading monooxygenase HmoA